jgi:CBS domain-containing protein
MPRKRKEPAMGVKDIMTPQPISCSRRTNVAAAAALMLEGDCGILPVLEDGRLVGVITDRDLFIALATRNVRASDLHVGDVMRDQLFTCAPDDDVQAALAVMKEHRVRRLPVVAAGDVLVGIISMNDVVCTLGADAAVASADAVAALQGISAHRLPAQIAAS